MSKKTFDSILVYTDGACSGNPGPGGWAAIIATPDGHVRECGDAENQTTNNRMELMAAIVSLEVLADDLRPVRLYTDSAYVIRGITQWVWGWRKRGWKNAEGEDVANQDLWQKLSSLTTARGKDAKVEWLYSRGHVGTPGNERCDEIAVAFSQKKYINLYRGPILKYNVAIFDEPEDTTLPEMKPKAEKKAAYSYLSVLNGEVRRHKDWPSCERRIKGQSGAKCKKSLTQDNEAEILAEWGYDVNDVRES